MRGRKVPFNVAVRVQNVHDLEAIIDVAEEQHVIPIGEAADVGTQLGPCLPERAGQPCQFVALRAQLLNEGLRYSEASAAFRDVDEDVD